MPPKFHRGDPVYIIHGVNTGTAGTVIDQAVSGEAQLYLVQRAAGSSWVAEEDLSPLEEGEN